MSLHFISAALYCHLIGSFPKIPIHLLMAVICACVAMHVCVSHMSSHVLILLSHENLLCPKINRLQNALDFNIQVQNHHFQ